MATAVPINYTGNAPLSALPRGYRETVVSASTDIKARYPGITTAVINGATPQTSLAYKSDTKPVIIIYYSAENGDHVLTIEAHDDMTYNGLVK
ncbi:hypothetical protein GGR51DRAFT_561061 [Nemania sp. FL0031]|nr:hypothetical protein GGR51DRAFT_561061 [Nemania sp. FL0031]